MTQYHYPPPDMQEKLSLVASRMIQSGKGLLAADETVEVMGKRFEPYNIENNEENRRVYRQVLLTAAPDISTYISAVILTEETFHQKTDDGKKFRKILKQNDIIAGVQVDKGLVQLYGSENETTTQGLDNLSQRCAELKDKGCEFAKWRCVIQIGKYTPSARAIVDNANVMARFSSICQSEGIVPVVQTEILLEGDHSLDRCQNVTEAVLAATFKAMHDYHVYLEGTILLTSMVMPGSSSTEIVTAEEVAKATVTTMRRCVPPSIAGITFLSGGQTEEMATIHLNEINKIQLEHPWKYTFAFGRALQDSAFKVWAESQKTSARFCTCRAQECLIRRARANSYAAKGEFIQVKAPYVET